MRNARHVYDGHVVKASDGSGVTTAVCVAESGETCGKFARQGTKSLPIRKRRNESRLLMQRIGGRWKDQHCPVRNQLPKIWGRTGSDWCRTSACGPYCIGRLCCLTNSWRAVSLEIRFMFGSFATRA